MAELIDNVFNFFKKEIIFSISLILAVISCFFVKPSFDYFNYINWETILLLFVIMLIVEVLKNLAIFEILVRKLLTKIGNARELVLVLVFICFFSSIFITNDVSLIIFVPFAILALKKVDRVDLIIFTISLQTIAANVGCMVLPIGAPHNIVMYTVSQIPFESFFLLLLPYIVVSLIFLVLMLFYVSKDEITLPKMSKVEIDWTDFLKRTVFGVDYFLLLTFIALFILIGNLENIPFIIDLARRTRKIIYQNLVLSISISVVMIALSAFGIISALAGSLLHNFGAFAVLLNSSRILREEKENKEHE